MSCINVVGTRLGRQSNSAKLSTLMQYQCDTNARPPRLSEYSVHAGNGSCHGDSPCDDVSGGGCLLSMATRSNSDAASLSDVWSPSRRRRSDTDTERSRDSDMSHDLDRSSRDTDRSSLDPDRSPLSVSNSPRVMDNGQTIVTSTLSPSSGHAVVSSTLSPAGRPAVGHYEMLGVDTNLTTSPPQRLPPRSFDRIEPCTIDTSAIDAGSPLETYPRRQRQSVSDVSPDHSARDQWQRLSSENHAYCTSTVTTMDHGTIDVAVSPLSCEQRHIASFASCGVTTDGAVVEKVCNVSSDMNEVDGEQNSQADESGTELDEKRLEYSTKLDDGKLECFTNVDEESLECSTKLVDETNEIPVEYTKSHEIAVECTKSPVEYSKSHALQLDLEHDYDQLLFQDPVIMLSFMAEAFRELDEIMNRVCVCLSVCLPVCLSVCLSVCHYVEFHGRSFQRT